MIQGLRGMVRNIDYSAAEDKMRVRGHVINPEDRLMLRDFYEILYRDCECGDFEEFEYTDRYGSFCTYRVCKKCGEIYPGRVLKYGQGV